MPSRTAAAALLAAALAAAAPAAPPVCDPGGGASGYEVALVVPATAVRLDASGSFDPDPATTLTWRWELLTCSGRFDDPEAPSPTLLLDTREACRVERCAVKLTVSDGDTAVSCFTQVRAAPRSICPIELVAVLDTSSSMFDDGQALCASLDRLLLDLAAQGIEVKAELLGITSTAPASVFNCLTGHVKGATGDPRIDHAEDWGPAVAVLAEKHPWEPGRARLILPISDEAPEDGDPCLDPGADRDAIDRAIAAANAARVVVSPIAAQGASPATIRLGRELAAATRGSHFESAGASDLPVALPAILRDACTAARPVTCAIAPPAELRCTAAALAIPLDGSPSSVSCATGSYLWTSDCPGARFDDPTAVRPTLRLDAGTAGCALDCTVTLLVAEGSRVATCSAPIRVRDDGPPVVRSNALDGACLWPPDHRLVCFEDLAALLEVGECGTWTARALACRSSQPDDAPDGPPQDGNGDGHTTRDCQLLPGGRGVCLRAERLGGDPLGRTYTIDLEVADSCGQTTASAAAVRVPHDARDGAGGCLDAGGGGLSR